MLYWLLYEKLFPFFHPFRIFRYLTFRTAFASLTALLIALFIGPWVIQKLREFQIGQYVREDGPQSHLKKTGTPTMGGVLIVHRHSAAHGAVVRSRQSVCLDHGFFHAGLRRHRLCRRLHQGGPAAQPGPDGARQAALAGAGRRAGGRCAGGAGAVQALLHAADRAVHQKPAPRPAVAPLAGYASAPGAAGLSAVRCFGSCCADGHRRTP